MSFFRAVHRRGQEELQRPRVQDVGMARPLPRHTGQEGQGGKRKGEACAFTAELVLDNAIFCFPGEEDVLGRQHERRRLPERRLHRGGQGRQQDSAHLRPAGRAGSR